MTGQRGFAAGEMEPVGSKRRGFAVGDPARRSRDGDGKTSAPVGPMTGRAVSRSEMRPNGSKRRGASAGPRQAELGGVASTLPPVGALPGMELVGSGVPGGLPGAGMPVQGGAGLESVSSFV